MMKESKWWYVVVFFVGVAITIEFWPHVEASRSTLIDTQTHIDPDSLCAAVVAEIRGEYQAGLDTVGWARMDSILVGGGVESKIWWPDENIDTLCYEQYWQYGYWIVEPVDDDGNSYNYGPRQIEVRRFWSPVTEPAYRPYKLLRFTDEELAAVKDMIAERIANKP